MNFHILCHQFKKKNQNLLFPEAGIFVGTIKNQLVSGCVMLFPLSFGRKDKLETILLNKQIFV
jgi:hypothetical protein